MGVVGVRLDGLLVDAGPLLDVDVGDVAVGVVLVPGGAVEGEPFLGGDGRLGLVGGVLFGEVLRGGLAERAGHGGGGVPLGVGLGLLFERGAVAVQALGERGGVVGLAGEAVSLRVVGRGVGLGAAQLGGLPVSCFGLAGAGEEVLDVGRAPGLFALPRADADAVAGGRALELVALVVGQARGRWAAR